VDVLEISAQLSTNEKASTTYSGSTQRPGMLIITHKFLEPPVERDAKAELMAYPFDATWPATMVRKNSPKDMGNDKARDAGEKREKDQSL
jgi:hypothetical protein